MRFNLLSPVRAQSIPKVNVKQLSYEVLRLRRNHSFSVAHLRPLETMIGNIVDNLLNSFAAEGPSADEQLVRNNSQTPPIYREIFDRNLRDDLGGDVVRSADKFYLARVSPKAARTTQASSPDVFRLLLGKPAGVFHLGLDLKLGKPKVSQFEVAVPIDH
jgi:hypothetical protein